MMVTMSMMVMTVIILSACLLAAKSIVFEQLLSLFKLRLNIDSNAVILGVAKKA